MNSGSSNGKNENGALNIQIPASSKARRIRFTLDLEPTLHKDLKRFALEAEVDASEVMRALLKLLNTDTAVRNAVLTAVARD